MSELRKVNDAVWVVLCHYPDPELIYNDNVPYKVHLVGVYNDDIKAEKAVESHECFLPGYKYCTIDPTTVK